MKTRLTELLGIDVPIICGGMMRVDISDPPAAASNTGGLGVITALTQPAPENLEEEIKRRQSLIDCPFGINLTVGEVAAGPFDDPVNRVPSCQERIDVIASDADEIIGNLNIIPSS